MQAETTTIFKTSRTPFGDIYIEMLNDAHEISDKLYQKLLYDSIIKRHTQVLFYITGDGKKQRFGASRRSLRDAASIPFGHKEVHASGKQSPSLESAAQKWRYRENHLLCG